MDPLGGVMKTCTLCIDRIYNENIPKAQRQPACVNACPTRARHFGDLADPDSDISKLVDARGGVDLMAEMGYRPTNKYLPPRPKVTERRKGPQATQALAPADPDGGFLGWLDRLLSD
jgi:Fe-S-cluster-containing dehydrogenase component